MKILVLNSGSSSIKFQLWDTSADTVMCSGLIERIGHDDAVFSCTIDGRELDSATRPVPDHTAGIQLLLDAITDSENGVLDSIDGIGAVGHRVVHGGDKITRSELITPEIHAIIEKAVPLAPLHNPPNLMGIDAIHKLLPGVPNVGVFDTAFHASLPEHAYVYPIAYEYYKEHGIRRFGFHGTSHQYVAMRSAKLLNIDFVRFNCITCHMGNGVSLTAVRDGKSVDTTLGYGTMCGVPMGTRAGDIDPAIVLYLMEKLGMSVEDVSDLLYHNSGLLGISGISNDVRDIEEAAASGNHRAELALQIFAHYAGKNICALAANMKGRLDAVIFTAGIGENAPKLRAMCCEGIEIIGARLDTERNKIRGKEAVISRGDSAVKILVIPTNEEHMIALETRRVVEASL